MQHVVDASVAVQACLSRAGFEPLAAYELIAPRLLWSEAASALHELAWRGDISLDLAREALARLEASPIVPRDLPRGPRAAFEIADRLGWAKTYDAEYVALAAAVDGVLITSDARLRRGVTNLIRVIGPAGD